MLGNLFLTKISGRILQIPSLGVFQGIDLVLSASLFSATADSRSPLLTTEQQNTQHQPLTVQHLRVKEPHMER